MPAVAPPIDPQECDALFAAFDRPLALAVSGGVDSMALMHLVATWHRRRSIRGPVPLVLTVDHGLRPAAAEEAQFVAAQAHHLGFQHETLNWTGSKPTSGIQDAARRARYHLMLDRLAADDVTRDLVLAHHMEDQAETLLMRLARGSGIDGLAAMRPVERRTVVRLGAPVRERSIRLLRPLLGTPKCRLLATLQAASASWRDDPSNVDVRFERVRLRRAQPELAALGLTPESLARTARRLGQERVVLQARAREFTTAYLNDHNGAGAELSLPHRSVGLVADLVRVLARLVDVWGGDAPAAQLSQIETLAERVSSSKSTACGRLTLGGCLIDIRDDDRRRVVVMRETTRGDLPLVTLQPGEGLFWDRRFYVSLAAEAPAAVRIGPWPPNAAAPAVSGLPKACAASLPAVETAAAPLMLWGGNVADMACTWPDQHRSGIYWLEEPDPVTETI